MISKFRGTNTFVHNDFEIDFKIKSKKSGYSIKEDDYILFKNDKIQKKLGLIGCNASGKSSILEKISLFNTLWNYEAFWSNILNNAILELNREKLSNKNSFNYVSSAKNNNNYIGISDITQQDSEFLLNKISLLINIFYDKASFDKFRDVLIIEFDYYINDKLHTNIIELNKNGYLKLTTKNSENKILFSKEINLISLEIQTKGNINKEYNINFIKPNFDDQLLVNKNKIFSSTHSLIIMDVLNYITKFNKKIHFVNWLKIADKSISDISIDERNKLFHIIKSDNVTLDLNSLSLGTIRWIILYHSLFILLNIFGKNSTNLLIIDEIENSLHYKLVDVILGVIDNSEKTQLLFSTHNPYIFDEFFRHDGIYLTKYEDYKYTTLRLDELKLKKDIVIPSQYLKEFIGEHPDKQNILNFWDENDK